MRWSQGRARNVFLAILGLGLLAVPARYVARTRLAVAGALVPALQRTALPGDVSRPLDDPRVLRERLREQQQRVDWLTAALAHSSDRLRQLAAEIERLGRYRDLAGSLGIETSRAVAARILRRGINWGRGTWLIDRGRRDGIEAGCGVLAGPAVVGVVIEAGRSVSRVALITTPGVQIPVRIVETRQLGMARGQRASFEPAGGGSATLRLDYIGDDRPSADHPSVAAGQVVVTAGLDGIFPAGLLIGKVTHARRQEGVLFYEVAITPAARFAQTETVIVLKKSRVQSPESRVKTQEIGAYSLRSSPKSGRPNLQTLDAGRWTLDSLPAPLS